MNCLLFNSHTKIRSQQSLLLCCTEVDYVKELVRMLRHILKTNPQFKWLSLACFFVTVFDAVFEATTDETQTDNLI